VIPAEVGVSCSASFIPLEPSARGAWVSRMDLTLFGGHLYTWSNFREEMFTDAEYETAVLMLKRSQQSKRERKS